MSKTKYLIIPGIIIIVLIIMTISLKPQPTNTRYETSFFTAIENQNEIIETTNDTTTEVNIIPPEKIKEINNINKIDIISELYPDFYANLKNTLENYERGNLLSLVNIFLNSKIKEEYLFSKEIDIEIIKNTNIDIVAALISDDKLILETKITYIPLLVECLKNNKNITLNQYSYTRKIKDIPPQTEYFTLTFDILKFSKSEGIKIKDYKYKDYIIRALTSTMYDSKKSILEYSTENNQKLFDNIIKDLRQYNYENQTWMSAETIMNIKNNQIFFDAMLQHITIKSVNMEYYIITYPDIKNYDNTNLTVEDLIYLINNNEINYISKIVHDPQLNRLYNLIVNLWIES